MQGCNAIELRNFTIPKGENKLFLVYGHSYEFERDDNWEVLKNLVEYVGGHEDVWYATSIEIFDYVEAYKRLQTSYDKKIIHNPSAIPIWVELGGGPSTKGQQYCIQGGETLIM